MKEKKDKNFTLSASKLETFSKCSLVYYANYIAKIRDTNDGARRGSVCHDIFEYPLNGKDSERVQKILDSKTIESDSEVKKKVKKLNSKSKKATADHKLQTSLNFNS